MTKVNIVLKKEVREWISSPSIYFFSAIFTFICSAIFYNNLLQVAELTNQSLVDQVITPTFSAINFLLMFYTPMLTMGAFVKEKNDSTLDLLLLSKLSMTELYLGKFFAAILKSIFVIVPLIIIPIILTFSGFSDWSMIFTNFLGIIFLLLAYVSVGLFSSIISKNYIIAIVISFGILFSFLMLFTTGTLVVNDMLGQIIRYLSIGQHISFFARGAIVSYDMIYFVSFSIFFSYMGIRVLGIKK